MLRRRSRGAVLREAAWDFIYPGGQLCQKNGSVRLFCILGFWSCIRQIQWLGNYGRGSSRALPCKSDVGATGHFEHAVWQCSATYILSLTTNPASEIPNMLSPQWEYEFRTSYRDLVSKSEAQTGPVNLKTPTVIGTLRGVRGRGVRGLYFLLNNPY